MKKLLSTIILLFIGSLAFSQITLTSTVSNVSCFGGANGSATVSATGGTGAYTYTWMPTNTNFDVITGLQAGTYTVYVEDAVANTNSVVVIIGEPNQLTASLTATFSSCGQANGQICAYVTGGTTAYSYQWSNGVSTLCNSNVFAGAFTFTVTDINSCIAVANGIVNDMAGPVVSISSQTNVSCFGLCNGAANISIAGGASPYVYNWSNGQVSASATNLCPGVHTVSVTDQAGCIGTTSVIITQPPQLSAIVNAINVRCFGTATGSLSAAGSGGTAPYAYFWPAISSTLAINPNIPAGNYQVSVTDANGCNTNGNVTVLQPTQVNNSVNVFANACYGTCSGAAVSSVSGGTAPYNWQWSTGQSTQQVTNLCPGIQSVQVTDIQGCVSTHTFSVMPSPQIIVTTTVTNSTCLCNGMAGAVVTGGTSPYTYLWNLNIGGQYTTQNIANLCAGFATLTVTDAMNCPVTIMSTFSSSSNSSMTNATITSTSYNETCYLSGDGAIDISITGSNPGPFTYSWNNGGTTQDVNNLIAGYYTVTIYDANMDCLTITDTISITGTNCGSISGNVYADLNSDCLKNTGDNNLSNILIEANPGNRLGYTNGQGDYQINNLPYGTYTVTATSNNSLLTQTCTTTINTQVDITNPNSLNNQFAFTSTVPAQPDLNVSAYSNGIVPGFVCHVNYYLSNYSYFGTSGIYKVTLPSTIMTNIISAPTGYIINGDTLIWNFNIGGGYMPQTFTVFFTTPLSTPLGSSFSSCIWAQPSVTDLNYTNNTYCYSRTVTGSFDPNDKTVSPAGTGPNGDIAATETDLTYLIRFQNTGNGPAVNIVVKDTLSPNVDINTFEMLGSSHNYNIDVLNGNVLRWKFNNIMLPDSNSNEPGSHGYIHYRIKRNSNNAPGTQIKNTAYIYFDFNEPVVTNTAINTIETITGIQSQNTGNDQWLIYPNPSTGLLNLVNNSISADTKLQIQIINSFGQLLQEEFTTANHKTIDLGKFSNGVYFVKLVSDKQSTIKRIVLNK